MTLYRGYFHTRTIDYGVAIGTVPGDIRTFFNTEDDDLPDSSYAAWRTAVTLKMGVTPFVVDYSEVDMYDPLLCSGATIKFITNGLYSDFMVDSARQTRVTLFDITNNQLIWKGYLTPNVYSQKYDHDREELELNAVDDIAALEFISYKTFLHGATPQIKSMYTIMEDMLLNLTMITHLHISETILLNGEFIMKQLYVNEQLFVDEELSCKEVLDIMLKYVNLTGMYEYYFFTIMDRDKTDDFKYRIVDMRPNLVPDVVVNSHSYETTLDDYFDVTVSTKEIYKYINYTAKFGEFPTWSSFKDDNEYDTQNIISYGHSGVDGHVILSRWPTSESEVGVVEYLTRVKMISCPNNVTTYALRGENVTINPTFDNYLDMIRKCALTGTYDAGTNDANIVYDRSGAYINIEDTRDQSSFNNIGTPSHDCFVLFTNTPTTGARKLVEIKYNSQLLVTNRGYLDISGSVNFGKIHRRMLIDNYSDKVNAHDNKTTNLMYINMSVQVGDYYYAENGTWSNNVNYMTIDLDVNKKDLKYEFHDISKSFVNIDIENKGFLVDLSQLPDVCGDVKIGLWGYSNYDVVNYPSCYEDIDTIFVENLDVSYINFPLKTGDVEYYHEINNIYNNSYEDDNLLSTFIDNADYDLANNRAATQHPPCNNMVLVKISDMYIPASAIVFSDNVQGGHIPEDWKVDRLYNQHSTHTMKFELMHYNDYDIHEVLTFANSTSGYKYHILGASVDYYFNLTKYILVQKK